MLLIKQFVTKPLSLPITSPTARVSSILSKTQSTHDPVLVFEKHRFLGMVWPYMLLYKNRPYFTNQIKQYIKIPPRLTPKDQLSDALTYMLGERVYALPIWDDGTIIGQISAYTILEKLPGSKELFKEYIANIDIGSPLVVPQHTKIRDVYTSMRKNNSSRAIITDKKGEMIGVVRRRDIYGALLAPPDKKQRYKSRDQNGQMEFDEDWIKKLDYPLEDFLIRDVPTALHTVAAEKIIAAMMKNKARFVVLTDAQQRPKGLLSIRSCLKSLSKAATPKESIIYQLHDKSRTIDFFHREEIEKLLYQFAKKHDKHLDIHKLEMVVDAAKNIKQKARAYDIGVHVTIENNKMLSSHAKGRVLRDVVRDSLTKLHHQLRD